MARHEIPLIDLSPYLREDASTEAKASVIDEVKSACSTYGFLQIQGHGIPLDAQQDMLQCCKTLFDLPQEQKDALSLKNSRARRDKSSPGPARRIYDVPTDTQHGFYIGNEDDPNSTSLLRGANQWPSSLLDPAFHAPVMTYHQHMLHLARSLLEILVLALGRRAEDLATLTADPVTKLKLLHYPRHISVDARQFGAGAHTDFGLLTILLQQPGKTGLQVFHPSTEEWLSVPAVEDVFVVNIGDLIKKWTDGQFTSTLHRVINAADGDRYSVPCFYEGDPRATNPFKADEGDGETVEMHIRRKLNLSYGLDDK